MISVESPLESKFWATKHDCACNQTTSPCVDYTASDVSDPIEVMETPEFGNEDVSFNQTLFSGSVNSRCIQKAELKPEGSGITM